MCDGWDSHKTTRTLILWGTVQWWQLQTLAQVSFQTLKSPFSQTLTFQFPWKPSWINSDLPWWRAVFSGYQADLEPLSCGAPYLLVLVLLPDLEPILWGSRCSKICQNDLVQLEATNLHRLMGCWSIMAPVARSLMELEVLCFNLMLWFAYKELKMAVFVLQLFEVCSDFPSLARLVFHHELFSRLGINRFVFNRLVAFKVANYKSHWRICRSRSVHWSSCRFEVMFVEMEWTIWQPG